jgi:hypothetical protein
MTALDPSDGWRLCPDLAGSRRWTLKVQAQEEDCRKLAGRLGWQVIDGYEDNDVSAFNRRKPRTFAACPIRANTARNRGHSRLAMVSTFLCV